MIAAAIDLFERTPVPDPLTRLAIRTLVGRTSRSLAGTPSGAGQRFAAEMTRLPIAAHTDAANAQHYEVPAEFFRLVLGPQRKYSCCLFDRPATTLAEAEERALAETASHAGLKDGQSILELGCGWGSLSLWMARHLPKAQIVAVSNSQAQRKAIEARREVEALGNLSVITADINAFEPDGTFDRVVSVEMFEHMSNWQALLGRTRRWLKPNGRLFLHVFTHPTSPYRFDHTDPADWIGRHFFTGGIMPSADLIRAFGALFTVEHEWRWSGDHYQRTAEAWLANFDRERTAIGTVLAGTYGRDARLWERRWRLFFLATAGLFGYRNGAEWGVSHYRLKPAT